jgi:hypothetical protein
MGIHSEGLDDFLNQDNLLNSKNKLNSSFLQAIREFHRTHVPEGYWIATLAMTMIQFFCH